MIKLFSCLVMVLTLAGCAGDRTADGAFHVTLVKKGPGKMTLEITRHEQVIVTGPDGYMGSRKVTYWAALAGDGPTFVNPHFADSPTEYHCIGSITLDTSHELVSIDMRRIVSKPGEPEETAPHPANGVYHIEKMKESKREWWF
jgi:hypothetical protein